MILLKPNNISGEIMTLLDEADEKVIIVSPYCDFENWIRLRNRFKALKDRSIDIEFYVKANKNDTIEEVKKIGINPICVPNLHAKLYMNEKTAIVSSLNLLRDSEIYSIDIGYKTSNKEEYDELVEFHNRYIKETVSEKGKKANSKEKLGPEKSNQITFDMETKYNELYNFHLPSTYKLLVAKYPNLNIDLSDNIKIKDYPKKGIITEISGRIDLRFSKTHDYNLIQDINHDKLKKYLPKVRFYWNEPVLNIYLESKFNDELTSSGLERKAKRFTEIITTVATKMEL